MLWSEILAQDTGIYTIGNFTVGINIRKKKTEYLLWGKV